MDAHPSTAATAAILNACYLVRQHWRPWQEPERAAAIRELGLVCRKAFNQVDDFEQLLGAIVDGLAPRSRRF